jgi:hypothetical protein
MLKSENMQNQNQKEKPASKLPTREGLILAEQEIINDLRTMMQDAALSMKDRLRAAAVLSYHMNALNAMLTRDDETDQHEELDLGDLVKNVEPRIVHLEREPQTWKRRLSLKRH